MVWSGEGLRYGSTSSGYCAMTTVIQESLRGTPVLDVGDKSMWKIKDHRLKIHETLFTKHCPTGRKEGVIEQVGHHQTSFLLHQNCSFRHSYMLR